MQACTQAVGLRLGERTRVSEGRVKGKGKEEAAQVTGLHVLMGTSSRGEDDAISSMNGMHATWGGEGHPGHCSVLLRRDPIDRMPSCRFSSGRTSCNQARPVTAWLIASQRERRHTLAPAFWPQLARRVTRANPAHDVHGMHARAALDCWPCPFQWKLSYLAAGRAQEQFSWSLGTLRHSLMLQHSLSSIAVFRLPGTRYPVPGTSVLIWYAPELSSVVPFSTSSERPFLFRRKRAFSFDK